MNHQRRFTPEEIGQALALHRRGCGIDRIARTLQTGRETLLRELERNGHKLERLKGGGWNKGQHRPKSADPALDYPIGSIPPGHPFYELDQQMLRARTMRHRAVGGWRQSSLADAA